MDNEFLDVYKGYKSERGIREVYEDLWVRRVEMSNGKVIERFKKAVDRGVMKETREITASIKGYADSDKLDEAIKHYEELSKERYLYNPHNKDLYRWLKELRDRRKEEWL